jgi:hypothetical protein
MSDKKNKFKEANWFLGLIKELIKEFRKPSMREIIHNNPYAKAERRREKVGR